MYLSDKTLLGLSNKNQLYYNNRASKIFAGYSQNDDPDSIRSQVVRDHILYHDYWKDCTILIAFLSSIGLFMVAYKWNLTYTSVKEMRTGLSSTEIVTEVTTDMAIIACIARRFLEVQWSDYIDPLVFSSKLSRLYELQ